MSDNSSPVAFSDSIEMNLEILEQLLQGVPAPTFHQAKLAAVTIENAFTRIQKDSQGNAGAALGTAYAIYKIAQQLVERSGEGPSKADRLIHLLS